MLEEAKTRRSEDAEIEGLYLPKGYLEKIKGWAKNPRNFMVFSGNPGNGKTYFSNACFNLWEKEKKKIPHPAYQKHTLKLSEREFFSKMKTLWEMGWNEEKEIEKLCEIHHFILDDMGSYRTEGASKDFTWQIKCLSHFVDCRYDRGLPTLITTNFYSKQTKDIFGERIASRLMSNENLVVDLDWEDKRQIYNFNGKTKWANKEG